MTTKENLVRLNRIIASWVDNAVPEDDPDLQALRACAKGMADDLRFLRLYAFLACCVATALAAICILGSAIFAVRGELAKSIAMQPCADISVIAAMAAYWAMRK